MKTALKVVGGLALLLLLSAGGVFGWASWKSGASLSRTMETHEVAFPIPFPLSDEEAQAVRDEMTAEGHPAEHVAALDMAAVARERAIERGEHLVHARYGCMECHGENFGGGVMVDNAMIGSLLGPNITAGAGGRTADFTAADWDRIVRHGVRADGRPAAMPSIDFQRMSDQELSDIITYIQAQPVVDNTVSEPTLGPLGKILMATGQLPLSVDIIRDHMSEHRAEPPPAEPTVEFGEHLAAVCMGCHGENFAGGPIPGGDPSWVPAANLTPHTDGLAGWTFEQFAAVLVAGTRPDGTQVREPMSFMTPFGQNMTEVELRAIWAYLQTVGPVATEE